MEFHSLPQPNEVTQREREDAMGGYFMMFASIGVGLPIPLLNIIASIIYYYINKKNGKFVQFHTLQALLSHIPVAILNAVCVIWGILIFMGDYHFTEILKGLLVMTLIANLTYFTFSIIAAVKANKGLFYYFWYFGKLSYIVCFKLKSSNDIQITNVPPKI